MQIKTLPLEDFWPEGHTCTLLATGEKGLVLESRIEDGARKYHVHFDDRIKNRRQWYWERDLLMTGLTGLGQENLFNHLKGLGMDDDLAGEIMITHGCTPSQDTERAFYLLHGMTSTAAEAAQVQASIEAAMKVKQSASCQECSMFPCICEYKCKLCGEIMCVNGSHS